MTGDGSPEVAVGSPLADLVHLIDPATSSIVGTIVGNQELFGFSLDAHPIGLTIGAPGTGGVRGQGSGLGRVVVADPGGQFVVDLSGPVAGDRFGWDVASYDDVDGDQIDDVLVGAPDAGSNAEGAVYAARSSLGLDAPFVGSDPDERFGFAIDACDFDGDGLRDLVIGAPGAFAVGGNTPVGRVVVLRHDGLPLLERFGASANGEFGAAVSCGEDADGDGKPDLLIGAPLSAVGGATDAGRAFLFDTAGQLLAEWEGRAGDRLGRSVLLAGDQNGDGLGDVIVSSAHGGDGRGTSRLYLSDLDPDNDGLPIAQDNCPNVGNADQQDADLDGIGDACDSCPELAHAPQLDSDNDGDGDACDCAPTNPQIGPGRTEQFDGIDNQCPGEPGYGAIDELPPFLMLDRRAPRTFLSWINPALGPVTFQIARNETFPFTFPSCQLFEKTITIFQPAEFLDTADPAPGELVSYLVRAGNPVNGSWGTDGAGAEREAPCQ